jgi:hypothetical protein
MVPLHLPPSFIFLQPWQVKCLHFSVAPPYLPTSVCPHSLWPLTHCGWIPSLVSTIYLFPPSQNLTHTNLWGSLFQGFLLLGWLCLWPFLNSWVAALSMLTDCWLVTLGFLLLQCLNNWPTLDSPFNSGYCFSSILEKPLNNFILNGAFTMREESVDI